VNGSPVAGAVLVHGLWHGAWCWDGVRTALAARGVDSLAVELPLTDLAADTAATVQALDRFGRPAVLVGHSYGGAVVTGAGTHPLVRELVYVAAFQLDDGESVSRTRPGRELPDTRLAEAMRVGGDEIGLDPELGRVLLYGDAAPDVAADEVVHPQLQRAMAERATRTVEWPCGHSPAATRPDVVADLVAERVRAVG
jgi:pimeloyl-ACP methyl ester carboxylesterase